MKKQYILKSGKNFYAISNGEITKIRFTDKETRKGLPLARLKVFDKAGVEFMTAFFPTMKVYELKAQRKRK